MENEWKVDGNTFSKVKDLTIPGNKHEFPTNAIFKPTQTMKTNAHFHGLKSDSITHISPFHLLAKKGLSISSLETKIWYFLSLFSGDDTDNHIEKKWLGIKCLTNWFIHVYSLYSAPILPDHEHESRNPPSILSCFHVHALFYRVSTLH
jgi:hypothetical protein